MRAAWHWYVAVLTALSFCLVVASSASHLHKEAKTVHDCVICCVVLDKLAGAPPAPLLVFSATLQSYRIGALCAFEEIVLFPQLLPPSCGPPASA